MATDGGICTGHRGYRDIKDQLDLPSHTGQSSNATSAADIAVAYQLVTEDTNFILVHERAEGEKAQEMPEHHKVPQMLAAGWGGTGSVVLAHRGGFAHDILFNAKSSTNYNNILSTPSVWRTNRTQAAARVDALSSGGMDDFEIPAFLRKQADEADVSASFNKEQHHRRNIDKKNPLIWIPKQQGNVKNGPAEELGYFGLTPAGLNLWLSINHPSLWPTTCSDLRDLGLADPICEWLELELGSSYAESEVVAYPSGKVILSPSGIPRMLVSA